MTTVEIKAKKKELIEEIGADESLLESAIEYVRKIKIRKKNPCQFTPAEKEEILLKAEQDVKEGKGTRHEDFEKEFTSW